MGQKGPGRAERRGISLLEAVQRFGDEAEAERWFVERRWPEGIRCPQCPGADVARRQVKRLTPSYRCRECGKAFTVKTGTVMHDSKLPLSKWALAFYLLSTSLKGVSSMKLHRDLGVTQKTAWHLAHRIRETWDTATEQFAGPVEVDETYVGGKATPRAIPSKEIVVGAKDRATGQVRAAVVPNTGKRTLQAFVESRVALGATVYTDGHPSYRGLPFRHEVVNHRVGEYVRGQAHTQGIESFWSMLKRGYQGTYHHLSAKHLNRYVAEFAGRHNDRPRDTLDQLSRMARNAEGRRLPYKELIAD